MHKLLNYAEKHGIEILEKALPSWKLKGLYFDNVVVIKPGLEYSEFKCILSEELGHHATSNGIICDFNCKEHETQEHQAVLWACRSIIPFSLIKKNFNKSWYNHCEGAKWFDISITFLMLAEKCFRSEYGCELFDYDVGGRLFFNENNVLAAEAKEFVEKKYLISCHEFKEERQLVNIYY